MNQGVVDEEGHWHPIYSTGRDGIDVDDWYSHKVERLKSDLGYDCTDVAAQHSKQLYDCVKQVFGDEWYMDDTIKDHAADPRVVELMKENDERFAKYNARLKEIKEERTRRQDLAFMTALEREYEEDRPTEVGPLDKEHIDQTCRKFCHDYESDVGMMARCLDGIGKLGYDPICICSDCGQPFVPEYASDDGGFGLHVDNECYHGDGGIGIIYTRILCESCRCEVEFNKSSIAA